MTRLICIKEIETIWDVFGKTLNVKLEVGDIMFSNMEDNFDGTYSIYVHDVIDTSLQTGILIIDFYRYFTTTAKLREDRINDILND